LFFGGRYPSVCNGTSATAQGERKTTENIHFIATVPSCQNTIHATSDYEIVFLTDKFVLLTDTFKANLPTSGF
jgi:hypothetical protein